MGNSASRKRKGFAANKGSSTDVETQSRGFSPFRRGKTAEPPGDCLDCPLTDVPSKPGKAVVSLTNLQSDKSSGSCVTDSIYLDWTNPATDGGRPILGYTVEMYDLPTGNWVTVTQTEGEACRSMLDNILCGIMYRFRVRAFNEVGSSVPGIPSDSFVIDTPGVHIAPYFILCPPAEVAKYAHETVQFRAKALGTPKPNILWQKDDEPVFLTEGIDIQEEPDGSLLTVHNLQLDDDGVIQCIAVNHVGKAVASTSLCIVSLPKFKKTSDIPLHFTFRADEMIRLKFPFISQPHADLQILKNDNYLRKCDAEATVREENMIFKIDCAKPEDAGEYRITADNEYGKDEISFTIDIEVPPEAPGAPDVMDVMQTGQLTLVWDAPASGSVDHYIVEYYRDQWQLWLRMKTCKDTETVVMDLIPGSKYKFRIMSASIAGISDPSQESEEVMIGVAAEDELFDLPGPGPRGRTSHRSRRMNKMPSLDRTSLDRSVGLRKLPDIESRRQASLDREVYYDAENVRRDVVTYKPPEIDKIGSLSLKYKLSNEELAKYKMSMSDLCHKMKAVSNTSLLIKSSKVSLDEPTQPLKQEVTNQARKYNSMGQLAREGSVHIDREQQALEKSSSSSHLAPHKVNRKADLTNDVVECKKSLTDIRDRIGSLQSLLKTSRTLTASKQVLLADLPHPPSSSVVQNTNMIKQTKETKNEDTKARKTSFTTNRSDSYAMAIDDEEGEYEETHFPYNPDMASLGSLLCDKPENRQESQSSPPSTKRRSMFITDIDDQGSESLASHIDQKDLISMGKQLINDSDPNAKPFDIRALTPSDVTFLPLSTPEPDSSMSTMTLLADNTTMSDMTLLEDNSSLTELVTDRSGSACSQATLEGDDLESDTESLL